MPHIVATLHTPTRAQAVARAIRLGLFVPPALAESPESAEAAQEQHGMAPAAF
jgi:hypothetical protein